MLLKTVKNGKKLRLTAWNHWPIDSCYFQHEWLNSDLTCLCCLMSSVRQHWNHNSGNTLNKSLHIRPEWHIIMTKGFDTTCNSQWNLSKEAPHCQRITQQELSELLTDLSKHRSDIFFPATSILHQCPVWFCVAATWPRAAPDLSKLELVILVVDLWFLQYYTKVIDPALDTCRL